MSAAPARKQWKLNPFKVRWQDLANKKQDIFRKKTTFISTFWTSWRTQCLTFYNLQQENWKYKIQSYLRKKFIEKLFHSMNIWISWNCLLLYKLAKYSADNQRLKWSSKRKVSSVPVFKQDLQKTSKCFTVIKNYIQNITIKPGISQSTLTKNSSEKLKSHNFNWFSSRESLVGVCWTESLWKYLLENY